MELTLTSQPMAVFQERAATQADDFEAIVRQYRPKVFRFALASLRDADVAETIAQDCFLKAFKAQERFRHDCSMDTWLMQIAVNLVRDQIRNRRFQFWRRTRLTAKPVDRMSDWLSNGERSAESNTLLKERVNAVWDAAESLPERQRTVFLLRFVEDMELLEIAAVTGMKEGNGKDALVPRITNSTRTDGSQRMNPHLSSDDVIQWILGERSTAIQQHVEICSECKAKVAVESEALHNFRGSVRAWSDEELSAVRVRDWQAAAQSRVRLRTAWLALAMCLLVFVTVLWRRNATIAEGSPSDAALLTQVNSELSREVPSPMEPLMKLVSDDRKPAGERN